MLLTLDHVCLSFTNSSLSRNREVLTRFDLDHPRSHSDCIDSKSSSLKKSFSSSPTLRLLLLGLTGAFRLGLGECVESKCSLGGGVGGLSADEEWQLGRLGRSV